MFPLTLPLSPTTAEDLKRNSKIVFFPSTQQQAIMSSRFSITVVAMFSRFSQPLLFISD